MQLVDSIVSEKKRLNVTIQQSNTTMINFDDVTTGNIEEHHLIGCKFLIIHTEY